MGTVPRQRPPSAREWQPARTGERDQDPEAGRSGAFSVIVQAFPSGICVRFFYLYLHDTLIESFLKVLKRTLQQSYTTYHIDKYGCIDSVGILCCLRKQ